MQIIEGQLFQLGDHMLLCGDSLVVESYIKLLGNKKINLVLTDPPYGVGYVESKKGFSQGTEHKEIENDQDQTSRQYFDFSYKWLNHTKDYLDDHNSIYIFNSDKMLFALHEAMEKIGLKFSQLLIWVKNNVVVGRLDYLPQHELIAYGWCGKHHFLRSKAKSVLFCPKPTKSKLHPTMKPVSLLRKIILNSSKIGGYVFDPFGGSGSTLIACEQTKRKCLMIEKDAQYVEIIIKRWEKLSGKQAIEL